MSAKNKKIAVLICGTILLCMLWVNFLYAEKLTLPSGLKIVTEENRLIKIKQHEASISEADTLIARSGLLPHINAYYTQNYIEHQPGTRIGPQTVYTAEKSYYTYTLSVQQILYDFKGISSLHEASKKIFETKKIELSRVKNFVALQFALTYFELLESEKMIAVSEKEKERLESHLKVTKHLYTEGAITKNELLQAEVRLSDAKQKLLTARNMKKINTSRLNNLLAKSLTSPLEIEEVTRTIPVSFELNQAFEQAEKERHEVRIVDTTLEAVNLEGTSRKSEYFPKFFAEGKYNYLKNKYQLFEGNWSVMLGMNFNLLSGGSTKAELSKITLQKMKILIERKKLIDDIKLEVERYYLELVNAQEKVKVTKDAISQAEENLRINNIKYSEGIGTATDVIDAITLLTIAETNYYKSLYDLFRAEAGFMYSTGKDLLEVYR